MKTMLKAGLLAVAGVMLFALPGNADAHRGRWKKHRRGKKGCMGMLMRAPSRMLKKRAGLNDSQITKLKTLRTSFKKQMIPLRAKIKLLRVDMKDLLDNPNVDQAKVVALVQKIHTLKGQAKVLRVKTMLSLRGMLTAEQRSKLRKKCRRMRRFRRNRRFRRYGMRGGRHWHKRRWKKRHWHKRHWKKHSDKDDSSLEAPESKPVEKQAL